MSTTRPSSSRFQACGTAIEKLKRELGHTHLAQTLRYTELLEGDIVKAGEKVDADFSRSMTRLREVA